MSDGRAVQGAFRALCTGAARRVSKGRWPRCGYSPESMRFLGELAQARGDGVDLERASATWSTTSFTSFHGQLLSLAVQWGVAIEIECSVQKRARFA